MIIPNQPISGAFPKMCSENVRKRIKACGGKAVYGWGFSNCGDYRTKYAHCVWQDNDDKLWDVTPYFTAIKGEIATIDWPETIEFEPDPAAEWQGPRCDIPVEYIAVDPRLAETCRLMTIADNYMNGTAGHPPDLDKCKYWTDRANAAARRKGFRHYWQIPASMTVADSLRVCLPENAVA